jgi:signal transduction histidine kinase
MKAIYALLFLIPVVILLNGCQNQSKEENSEEKNAIKSAMLDSINTLDSLAEATKISDNERARTYAHRALALAKKSGSDQALATAFVIMGFSYKNYNNDTSLVYNNRALELARKNQFAGTYSAALYNLANLYYEASDLKTAIMLTDSVLKISRMNGKFIWLSNAYNFLGNIKENLNDTTGSRIFYDSAISIARNHGLRMQEGVAIASKAHYERDLNEKQKKLKLAIRLLNGVPGAEEEAATVYTNLGVNSANPDTALHYYEKAMKLANIYHFDEITIGVCNNQAYSYLDKKDFRRAEECLVSNAIPLAKQKKKFIWLANLYDTYTDILVAAKRPGEALKYARLAYQTRVLADQSIAPNQLRLLTTLLDVKNKELLIANSEKQLRQKESKSRMIIMLFSVSLLALALVIFFVLWRLQRNRLRYNTTMLKAAKKIIDAEERERTKIGKDFHDLTGQKFSGLSSYLENQDFPEPATKEIALRMLEEIRQAVREMSHRMNRAWVERFTLEESISGLCADCIKMASLNLEFHAPQKFPDMARETKIHLFRIVQELLANAMKHARTSKITLEISFDSTHLFLRYNDNGPGFDKDALSRQGSGLDNIIERVTIIGGKAELDTRPGFGTDYSITIPLTMETHSPTDNKAKS